MPEHSRQDCRSLVPGILHERLEERTGGQGGAGFAHANRYVTRARGRQTSGERGTLRIRAVHQSEADQERQQQHLPHGMDVPSHPRCDLYSLSPDHAYMHAEMHRPTLFHEAIRNITSKPSSVLGQARSVSYTHLTLPTILLV